MKICGLFLCLALTVYPVWCAVQKDRDVKPLRTWAGIKVDEELLAQARTSGYIANEKEWEKIWTLWSGGKTPKVDFAKHLILVCTTKTPNHCSVDATLSPTGNLKVRRLTTLIGSREKTFDYKFVLINRAGIKTIDGKRLNRNR